MRTCLSVSKCWPEPSKIHLVPKLTIWTWIASWMRSPGRFDKRGRGRVFLACCATIPLSARTRFPKRTPLTVSSDSYTQLQIHASTRGLSEDEINAIAPHVEIVRYEEGDVVLNPTDPVDALYLVAAGRLRVAVVLPGGPEKTILYLGRDDQFGLLAILQGEAAELKVVAEQHSILMRIPAEAALWLMHDSPLWGRNLLKALGPQLRNAILGTKQRTKTRGGSDSHDRAISRANESSCSAADLLGRESRSCERLSTSVGSRNVALDVHVGWGRQCLASPSDPTKRCGLVRLRPCHPGLPPQQRRGPFVRIDCRERGYLLAVRPGSDKSGCRGDEASVREVTSDTR